MSSLNPILRPSKNTPAVTGPSKSQKPKIGDSVTQDVAIAPASPRKVRSDKIHDVKFPVSPTERASFRKQAKAQGIRETMFATKLLRQAVSRYRSNPGSFRPQPYHDTKQYVHCKPTEFQYDEIFQIAVDWNLSVRQTVHRLMISMIQENSTP